MTHWFQVAPTRKHRMEDPPRVLAGLGGRSDRQEGKEPRACWCGGCPVATVGPAALCCRDSSSRAEEMLKASRQLWLFSRQEAAGSSALPGLCPGAPERMAPHFQNRRHRHLPKPGPLRENNDNCTAVRPFTQGTLGACETPSRRHAWQHPAQ